MLILNLLSFVAYLIVEGFSFFASAYETESVLVISENLGSNIAIPHSYTSLEYTQQYDFRDVTLIGNANVHYLEHSDWATNLGMGWRYPKDAFDLEFNVYYDALIDKQMHHQLGLSGGFFSPAFDARCNIYVPIGAKTYKVKSVQYDYPGGYIVDCIQKRTDLSGVDIECGKLFDQFGSFLRFYGTIGGYGYRGKNIDNIYGVRTRLNCDLWNKLKADLVVTHDKVFKTSVQFSLSVYFPFGDSSTRLINTGRQDLILREPSCYSWKTNY